MAAGSRQTIPPWALIALGVMLAAGVFAFMHDGHYRERRIQLLEGRLSTLENMLTGKHGRTA